MFENQEELRIWVEEKITKGAYRIARLREPLESTAEIVGYCFPLIVDDENPLTSGSGGDGPYVGELDAGEIHGAFEKSLAVSGAYQGHLFIPEDFYPIPDSYTGPVMDIFHDSIYLHILSVCPNGLSHYTTGDFEIEGMTEYPFMLILPGSTVFRP